MTHQLGKTQEQNQKYRISQDSFAAWHGLYRDRLLNGMTAMARDRDAAEDITAAALASAWRNRNQFRGESSLYTWVFRIGLNELRQRRPRHPMVSLDAIEGPAPEALRECDRVCDKAESAEACGKLRQALRQIPARYRQVLTDHFVHGFSTKQIARRDRIPLGTVLSRIFTGKRLLRRAWESVP